MISNEPILALWNGLALELENLASPRGLPHGFLETTLCKFSDEGFDLGEDVFSCVTAPAIGTSEQVLRLSISRTFHRYATSAAKDFLGVIIH